MQTTLNWTSPFTWLSLLALIILLAVQGWLLGRNSLLTVSRKRVRLGLNLLVWLVLLAYVLQPRWPVTTPATRVLLAGDEVPVLTARRVQDSLHLPERFTSRQLTGTYDSVTLLGNQFPMATLARLSSSSLQRVPYRQPDELERIHWKGMLRQGERQRVTGLITVTKPRRLRLRYGGRTLDSLAVDAGVHPFALHFAAFARGKSQVELVLDDNVLDTLRFFSRPTEPMTVEFLLNSPDFESNMLANWLGRQGHTVTVSATLSKGIASHVSINKTVKATAKNSPDLIVTEPDNAGNPLIRKAVADGRAVLFINLTNPDTDSRTINQAVGSRWVAHRTTNDPLVAVGNGLNALPYRFADNLNQFAVAGYPVFVQHTAGRVAVSLLSETFPLALSGDSVAYSQLWTAVLTRLSRPEKNDVQIDAPLIQGLQQTIAINNPARRLSTLHVGTDTLHLTASPLNDQSASGSLLFPKPGWQSVQDSLALYVEAAQPGNSLTSRALVDQFMQAHDRFRSPVEAVTTPPAAQLPEWGWFVLILLCFSALWLEPKLG